MKYWVYKDSQILGPLAKEDLALAGGVRPETLVCPEAGASSVDMDWRCAEDIGELAGLCAAAPPPGGEDVLLERDFALMERLQFDVLALPGEGEGWLADLFSAPARIPPKDLPKPDESAVEELKSAQKRVGELTSQIEQLSRRLAELEALPRPPAPPPITAAPLPTAPAPAQENERAPAPPVQPPVLQPLPEVKVPETLKPPEQAGPALGQDESPYRWEDQLPIGGGLPVAGSALPPTQAPLAPASEPEIPPAPKGRPRRVVKVSAPQSLRKVTRASQPASPPADKVPTPDISAPAIQPPSLPGPALKPAENPYDWGPQAAPAPAPAEPGAPPATVVPSFMPSLSVPPQPVLSPPPLSAPPSQTLQPPPVPSLTPAATPHMTMAFSAGSESAPPATGPAIMSPPPSAGPSTAQVLAKLAKPAPAKTEPPKAPPKSRGRTMIIVIVAATAVVAGAGWFLLFRDSSGLKTAMQMDSGRPPLGSEAADLPAPAQPKPQAAPQPQAEPAPQAPLPAPEPPPAETPRDERPAAIALVKDFPLDGDRGTVGQWLQYSFAASPGAADTEKWDAGAYEETTYAVKYTAQPTGKDAITYLFEADVARKTVKGMNEAARKMLAGGTPVRGRAAAKARPAQPRKRTPPRRAPAPPPPPKEVPLLPLPTDDELAPPADEENAFRSDTVRTNP
ncbi:MAG: hypothetical protein HY926_14675 [Elusimicrobia bacterium]|nr:hypothetical protein [Elusimicrobiota bacterium]